MKAILSRDQRVLIPTRRVAEPVDGVCAAQRLCRKRKRKTATSPMMKAMVLA